MQRGELTVTTDATPNFDPYVLGPRLDKDDRVHSYLAKDAAGEPVVLKWFRGERTSNRFVNESTYQLDHPNIARIRDVGRAGGHGYIVREFVDGVDLRQLAKAPPGRMKSAVVCDVMRQLCEVCFFLSRQRELDVGHEGIEHHRIVAKNVLLGVDGRVRLINFDRAEAVLSEEREKTRTKYATLYGPAPPDPALLSDQDSLFVLLYQLYSGHPAAEETEHVLSGPFGMPSRLLEALESRKASPAMLRLMIVKAVEEEGLEIEPEQVGEFVASLDGYRDFASVSAQSQ